MLSYPLELHKVRCILVIHCIPVLYPQTSSATTLYMHKHLTNLQSVRCLYHYRKQYRDKSITDTLKHDMWYCAPEEKLSSGVLQGLVLGPLSLLIYINDLLLRLTSYPNRRPTPGLWSIYGVFVTTTTYRDLDMPQLSSDVWLMNFLLKKCKMMKLRNSDTRPYCVHKKTGIKFKTRVNNWCFLWL